MLSFASFLKRPECRVLVGGALLLPGCFIEIDDVQPVSSEEDGMGGAPGNGGASGGESSGGSPGSGGGTGGVGSGDSGGAGTGGTGGTPGPEYGPNLITNGDFDDGGTGWDNGAPTPGPPALMMGMGCTSDSGDPNQMDNFLGWSGNTGGATLEEGTYRYEFRMVTSGTQDVEIKIASTVPPNFEPRLLLIEIPNIGDRDDTYSYQFVVQSDQSQIGMLFTAKDKVGQVCVDDVTLRRIVEP